MKEKEVTAKDIRWYNLAEKTAKLSECRYKLGSVIIKSGTVLSVACNVLRTHTDHSKGWKEWVVSIHSEHRALLLAQTNIEQGTIYVSRYLGNCSKPCDSCMGLLIEAGIRDIVFMEQGLLKKIRVA